MIILSINNNIDLQGILRRKNTVKKKSKIDAISTGIQINLYMKEIAVTIPAFTKYLCVSDKDVRNWIRGENFPTTERMYEVCKKLDVDIKVRMVEIKENK